MKCGASSYKMLSVLKRVTIPVAKRNLKDSTFTLTEPGNIL